MALNYMFIAFFVISFLLCCLKAVVGLVAPEMAFGDAQIFSAAVQSTFDLAKLGAQISIGYIGAFTLWLGLMKIGERGGVIGKMSTAVSPLFAKLFPDIPKGHPAFGAMMMNISANMLGLDNAATPMGLKAMKQLQELNPEKEVASNSQIMFLVLNTSGLTIIPLSIMILITELSEGKVNPTEYFIPILVTTFCSTLAGLLVVSIVQKLNIFKHLVVWGYLIVISGLMTGLVVGYSRMGEDGQIVFTSLFAGGLIMSLMVWFIVSAARAQVDVYATFIEGAKEGFETAIKIIPFLVGILVAIGLFRVSGGLELLSSMVGELLLSIKADPQIAEALPTAFTKPFSGGGARGMMIETIENQQAIYGIVEGMKTIPSRMVAVMQGSTETTFYVLAVYFGSVGIKNTRHAVGCGLFADFVGLLAAIFFTYLFFG